MLIYGQNFVGVHNTVGIKCRFNEAHGSDHLWRLAVGKELSFLKTEPVFCRYATLYISDILHHKWVNEVVEACL